MTDEKEAKVYPLPTHLQMIRARTVCQASGPLGAVFRAWREHATRHRRPTNYFGQVDPSDEQRRRAEQQRWEENQSLTWAKFPFRSQLLQGLESYCTLLFLYAAGRNGDELEEWLRTKLGDPEPYTLSAVRILTFEEEGKTLRIVFARVDTWDAMSVEEVRSSNLFRLLHSILCIQIVLIVFIVVSYVISLFHQLLQCINVCASLGDGGSGIHCTGS